MPHGIRRLLIPEAMLFAFAVLVLSAEFTPIAPIINPHSTLGGMILLTMWFATVVAVFWLLFAIPGELVALVRGGTDRNAKNVAVVCVGVAFAFLFGGWLVLGLVRS
jgi:hypothetical protein